MTINSMFKDMFLECGYDLDMKKEDNGPARRSQIELKKNADSQRVSRCSNPKPTCPAGDYSQALVYVATI